MDSTAQRAIEVAASLAQAAAKVQTRRERAEAGQLARMMDDEAGKAFTLAMADRVFRSHNRRSQARRLHAFLAEHGTPRFLPLAQRWMLRAGSFAARIAPGPTMAAMENELRRSSASVILPGEPAPLSNYLAKRKSDGIGVNLNQLGEAVLGEAESRHRLDLVLAHLADPAVDYISVKISAIFSQVNVIDEEQTLSTVKDRLRELYRSTLPAKKFVNLDMEEYRDLAITLAAFRQTLDEPDFRSLSAGIVLQAYIPDSWTAQQRLTEWAMRRVAAGGAEIKIRLVKGANLAMEAVDAELHGWNQAPYSTKAEADANYRRMVEYGCHPDHAKAVRIGVATHNLFDVALALVLREQLGTADRVELEMLEGMANHQARAAKDAAGGLLVYAPVVKRPDFMSAMAYLVRRLDENTAPENFLHDLFGLTPGSEKWVKQRDRFIAGWERRHDAPTESNRAALPKPPTDEFYNAPDTDWTQPRHRDALRNALAARKLIRPPTPDSNDLVLSSAVAAQPAWSALGHDARAVILRRAADVMEAERFDAIADMIVEGKKAAFDADGEASESIDYCRYVASLPPLDDDRVRATPYGVVVIAPPWNFPYAIPCGGIVAALIAGNSVILKPAPETPGIAYRLASQLWAAGVPRDVLQYHACEDGEVGKALIADPRVSAVVLTGAYETAQMFLNWRPSLHLFAETSGKNALVITAQADRDLAIKDLVRSAFGHAGQKCSAASVAILEAEVYDDPNFRRALVDAASSLRVGPATDLGSVVTPLIREPGESLLRALTTLDDGESWLLQPKRVSGDPCLWSPGIKLGVRRGSWFHRTECFGPVLGLMRAAGLDGAVAIQNDVLFGLTGGIHSLDESEIEQWQRRVEVGNAYVNRAITGAIVRRQPFGGWKRSSIGPGAKAGGPNYVAQFAKLENKSADLEPDYEHAWREYFSLAHDPSGLRCESNVLRYRPCRGVILRVSAADARDIEWATHAAHACGVPLHVSRTETESDAALIARLPTLTKQAEFLRTLSPPSDTLLRAAYAAGLNWVDAPILADGRRELVRWVREQSVSTTMHRYGLIAARDR